MKHRRRKAWMWMFVAWALMSVSAFYPIVDTVLTGLILGTLALGAVYGLARETVGVLAALVAPFTRERGQR